MHKYVCVYVCMYVCVCACVRACVCMCLQHSIVIVSIAAYLICTDPNRPMARHPILILGTIYANCSFGPCKFHGVAVTSYNTNTHN